MSRWLAGVFDPHRRIDPTRLHGPLPCGAPHIAERGALSVAFTGAPVEERGLLCLLDGHLDNAEELRRALALEHEPDRRSSSELERLLAAGHRRWGRELPGKLRGDFVLLLWDHERQEGLLARDQLGVRPCFLRPAADGLYFASELRDLLALLPTRPAPDPAWLAHWLSVGSLPGYGTPYAGIERLPPGTVLSLGADGATRHRYWRAEYRDPLELPSHELAVAVRGAINRAVQRRVAPEGATGLLLSGGLDSSAVAAICARQPSARVQACSATFPEHPAADESALIAELESALALTPMRAVVRPGGLLAAAIESVCTWQAPLLGWGDFWTLPLMRAAARAGVTVMLDGDGGDELFGVRTYVLADRLRAGRPLQAWSLAMRLPGGALRPPRREVFAMVRTHALGGALAPWIHPPAPLWAASRRAAPRWLGTELRRALVRSQDPLAWKRLAGPRWWAHAAYGVACQIEQIGVFEHQRRRAALAGLEARHPLFDLDLVELALRQPPLATLDPSLNRPVLRAALRGLLPDSVRLRPQKARFESLVVDCLRGPDAPLVCRLMDVGAELGAYVDLDSMRRELIDSPALLAEDPMLWMWRLWRAVNAECWLRAEAGSLSALASHASGANVAMEEAVRAGD